MASVKGDIRLNDFMTRSMRSITQAVNMTVSELDNMARKVGKEVDVSGLNRIRETISTVDIELENAVQKQEKLNQKVRQTTSSYSGLGSMIKGVVGALGIKKLVGLSDQNTQITARLNLMNDGNQTVDVLKDKIFASAQNSRADYFATADMVSKLGMQAKDAFNSNDELIAFSEQLNKNFVLAGTSQEGIASVQLQLTQALSSGVLRGEEFNAVFENGAPIIEKIANYMGVSVGQMRELAADGKITANIVKNALLASAEETNKAFKSMPLTWGQVWTMTVNKIIKISQPLLNFISMLAQNWERLEPIVLGVAAAIGTYVAIQTGYNIVTGIGAFKSAIAAAGAALHSKKTIAEAAATETATGAQAGLNAALLACPLTWIVIAIVALVAVLIYLWNTNDKVAKGMLFAWDSFLIGLQIFGLGFKGLWYGLLDFMGYFKIGALAIIDAFINKAVGMINGFIEMLNLIPGVSIDTISWRSTLATNAATEFAKEKAERDAELAEDALAIYNRAAELEATRDERVANRKNFGFNDDYENLLSGGLDIGNIGNVDNVSNVEGEVDVASEDLKLIRELAEQQYIQNYISNEPVLYITTGDINENADADYLVRSMATELREEMDKSMEGVPVG